MTYELKPYVLLVLGLVGVNLGTHNTLGHVSGVILLACTAYILYSRYKHRKVLR